MSLLSTQQEMIVKLAAHGLTNKEIARELNVGVRAIETQFVRMRKKLESANKTETIAEAMQLIGRKADGETAGLAEITRWMGAYVLVFDFHFRIVFANEAVTNTFGFRLNDADVGREVWRTITPGMDQRQRLKPLTAATVRDYAGHVTAMADSSGAKHTVVWSSAARGHPANTWPCWVVGWDLPGS